jgi:imidazolonepropionase-like amidohydrolase
MRIKALFLTIFLFLYGNSTHALSVYLQAKQYLDVNTGQLIRPANLWIEDGIIKEINPERPPSTAASIIAPELTLLPGLIDVHVHLTYDYNAQNALQFVQDTDATMALRGAKNPKTLLLAGFTTVRNLGLGGRGFADVALSKASEAGWIIAPHIIPAGNAISITGGHLDPDMIGGYAPQVLPVDYRDGVADGVDEVIKSVRYQIKHGAKVIKVAVTGGILSEEEQVGNPQFSYEEIKAIVEEANRHQIPVAAHAHGTEGINNAIKAGVRSIEHGSLLDDESITLMKQNKTILVPTVYVSESLNIALLNDKLRKKAKFIIPLAKKSLSKAIQSNVTIAFGTDSGVYPHGKNAKEFFSLVKAGMTSLQAIQTATINAAQLLNISDRGQIKMGMHADIIGIYGNPLENIQQLEHVTLVMKDGNLIKNKELKIK